MAHILITGATGMVGKGVLYACLKDATITKITLLTRRSTGISDPKIEELILTDFSNLDTIQPQLNKVDACFHCMGISSIGVSQEEFTLKTLEYTKSLADVCYEVNPKMTFCYVSGTGTSTAENSRSMWANVKGKTENYIINKGFERVFLFRPGLILPEDGIRSSTGWYNSIYQIMRPFYGLLKKSKNVTSTRKIGAAMIAASRHPEPLVAHLENAQINEWAIRGLAT